MNATETLQCWDTVRTGSLSVLDLLNDAQLDFVPRDVDFGQGTLGRVQQGRAQQDLDPICQTER
jgi:hypothetical protein